MSRFILYLLSFWAYARTAHTRLATHRIMCDLVYTSPKIKIFSISISRYIVVLLSTFCLHLLLLLHHQRRLCFLCVAGSFSSFFFFCNVCHRRRCAKVRRCDDRKRTHRIEITADTTISITHNGSQKKSNVLGN